MDKCLFLENLLSIKELLVNNGKREVFITQGWTLLRQSDSLSLPHSLVVMGTVIIFFYL